MGFDDRNNDLLLAVTIWVMSAVIATPICSMLGIPLYIGIFAVPVSIILAFYLFALIDDWKNKK